MVWSHFYIVVQFTVHFGDSVLDNSNWDKISHSLKKSTHMWERWGTPQNFLLAFIDELWKTDKSDFWKTEKIYWRSHHFTHVYQKAQSYEVQFLRYEVRRLFCHFGPFFALLTPSPLTTQKIKVLKKWKKHLEMSSF